jgi:hypothetical protein
MTSRTIPAIMARFSPAVCWLTAMAMRCSVLRTGVRMCEARSTLKVTWASGPLAPNLIRSPLFSGALPATFLPFTKVPLVLSWSCRTYPSPLSRISA